MMKMLFASVLALATIGLLSVDSATMASEFAGGSVEQEFVAVDFGRIRRVLHLTPEQERLWPPVEAALRDIARRQTQGEPAGFMHRVSHRVVSIALDGAAIRRLAVAARPLIAVLRDDQKQSALALAQEMGLAPVLAALN
jgi:hypothetical protein